MPESKAQTYFGTEIKDKTMYHGIINIYKEPGYTSHDVVARLRGILKQKKIGHTGTLDPAAEGVLPVCLGMGTRLCDMLTDRTKTYEAVMLLGMTTDTQDTTGQVLDDRHHAAMGLEETAVTEAVLGFKGDYDQIPPMYSALKVDGKKLYELARAGKEIERQARRVQILEIQVERMELPRVWMKVTCSKGTYIRTLCHDIGARLGCGGCMEHLTRTRVDRFEIKDSLKLDEVEAIRDEGRLDACIFPVEAALQSYAVLKVRPEADPLLYNGNPCFKNQLDTGDDREWVKDLAEGQKFRMYDSRGRFVGVYEYQDSRHWWKPWKMFLTSGMNEFFKQAPVPEENEE